MKIQFNGKGHRDAAKTSSKEASAFFKARMKHRFAHDYNCPSAQDSLRTCFSLFRHVAWLSQAESNALCPVAVQLSKP